MGKCKCEKKCMYLRANDILFDAKLRSIAFDFDKKLKILIEFVCSKVFDIQLTLFYLICKQSGWGRILATFIWFGLMFSFWMFHSCRTMWNEWTNTYRFVALIGIHWMNYENLLNTSVIECRIDSNQMLCLSFIFFWLKLFSLISFQNFHWKTLGFSIFAIFFLHFFSVLYDFLRFCDDNLFTI